MTKYHHHNRRKYDLRAHIVLATQYSKRLLDGTIADEVKSCIHAMCIQHGWELVAIETDYDHIHILVGYDTTERVCDIVRYIKQATTYQLWLRYKDVLTRYYWGYRRMLWSDGYFACSVV